MAAAASHEQATQRAAEEASAAAVQAQERLNRTLGRHGLDLARLEALLAHDAAWIAAQRDRLAAARRRMQESRAVLEERRRRRAAHLAEDEVARAAPAEDALAAALAEAEQAVAAAEGERARHWARLQADDEAQARATALHPELEAQRAAAERWQALSELIGSADGKKFRVFAQSLTLESLLHHANQHLGELARRYRLMRVPGHDLDLQVVDQEMGDEVRSTSSLSGGESFLVSLALALGLSSLAARDVRVDTLFIDEGFGTLDSAALESALAVLDSLQSTGRQIGLISHIPGLAERIGVQIQVIPEGGGRSRVTVVSG
jgi:exonuclease SbcC